jgi:hypothetical protein
MSDYFHRVSQWALAAAVASFAAVMVAPMTPAAAAPVDTAVAGCWVTDASYPGMYVESSRAGHIAGRLGNWHTVSVTIETDDDWVTGLVADWRCPKGVTRPIPGYQGERTRCTPVGGARINNPDVIPVTVSPRLRKATAAGNVTATDFVTGAPTTVDLDITWNGKGAYAADVTTGTYVNDDGILTEWRAIDAHRDGVVAEGIVDGFDLSARHAATRAGSIYLYTYQLRSIG